ncbi:MAG: D-2-hydroxyacid dehydrogenase family protein [Hydrogenophaga sp.]|jgi:D-3-phosphoglycerate dehydrogenase|nr:D-2-hydroxyacid dehydrogenase family protein [Hydrogenophaga sp.]MDP3326286.1 D-2-hydroxyacid dehydrogenase family protein [Hydrogenophaga sp.]
MKIAILDDYQDAVRNLPCFALLDGHAVDVFTESMGEDDLAQRLVEHEAVVLIRERSHMTATLLARLPNLRLISQTGKVSGNVDMEAAQRRGVTVMEGVGDPTAPAELSWALMMAAYRRIPQYVGHMKAGLWQTSSADPAHNGIGRAVKGDVLGIWGYGKIGQRMARYARAFDMDVLVWGREASRDKALADGCRVAGSQQALFEQADVLTLHLRLNEATRGIVKASDLALMKPAALLVNTSRSELIEAGALLVGLQQGRPGFAALDVFDHEPIDPQDPLLEMDNVLATPHLGYVEQKGYELYFSGALRNVVDFAAQANDSIQKPG